MKSENIIPGIIIAVCASVFGFGISQATLAVDVKTHAVEISHLKEETKRQIALHSEDKQLVLEIIKQNQEFINLLRVQNELLSKKVQ